MKVNTNLKAGGLVADSVTLAQQAVGSATGAVGKASSQANATVGAVGNAVSSGLDKVKGLFS